MARRPIKNKRQRSIRKTNRKTNRIILTDTKPKPINLTYVSNQPDMNGDTIPECEPGTMVGQQDMFGYSNGLVDWQWVCMDPPEEGEMISLNYGDDSDSNEICPPFLDTCMSTADANYLGYTQNNQILGGPNTSTPTDQIDPFEEPYWGPWEPLGKIAIVQSHSTQEWDGEAGQFVVVESNECNCNSYTYFGNTGPLGTSYAFPTTSQTINTFFNVGGAVNWAWNNGWSGYTGAQVGENEILGMGAPIAGESWDMNNANPWCSTINCEPPEYETVPIMRCTHRELYSEMPRETWGHGPSGELHMNWDICCCYDEPGELAELQEYIDNYGYFPLQQEYAGAVGLELWNALANEMNDNPDPYDVGAPSMPTYGPCPCEDQYRLDEYADWEMIQEWNSCIYSHCTQAIQVGEYQRITNLTPPGLTGMNGFVHQEGMNCYQSMTGTLIGPCTWVSGPPKGACWGKVEADPQSAFGITGDCSTSIGNGDYYGGQSSTPGVYIPGVGNPGWSAQQCCAALLNQYQGEVTENEAQWFEATEDNYAYPIFCPNSNTDANTYSNEYVCMGRAPVFPGRNRSGT